MKKIFILIIMFLSVCCVYADIVLSESENIFRGEYVATHIQEGESRVWEEVKPDNLCVVRNNTIEFPEGTISFKKVYAKYVDRIYMNILITDTKKGDLIILYHLSNNTYIIELREGTKIIRTFRCTKG